MTPRLRFDGVSKSFGGVRALDAVGFDVAPGCVHAIVGENGAGKSTLMKILAGVHRADAGRMELDGRAFAPTDPRAARRGGVAMVHQELAVIPNLSVAENVFLGRWPARRGLNVVRFADLHADTRALLDDLGIDLPVRAPAGSLSVAQQQMVEVARALSIDARVLVLDEPSAVLTPREIDALFSFVRRLVARNLSVLYISHRLDEIFELADQVTVLRDGRHVSTRAVREVTADLVIRETVGRALSGQFPARDVEPGEPLLEVEQLSSRGRFEDVSFVVRAGEVFGLTGLVGAGRSSIARALFGAAPVTGGGFRINRRSGPFAHPRAAKRSGVALVPEDRKQEGLLLGRSIRENLTLAHLSDVSTFGVLRIGRERATGRTLIDKHGIRATGTEAPMDSLSGGNQQKVLLARWVSHPYQLFVLDEPTRGVDVGAKAEIYELINAIVARGAAVLMISSELPEVIGLCDRIGVMCEGRLAGVLDNDQRQVTQEQIMRLAVGTAS